MTVHIVGAGLAGLAAAVAAAGRGRHVRLYEATGQAGGRCRSFFDASLGRVIDNGNHLLLSGNRATLRFLETIGAADRLAGPDSARFEFVDLATGERWRLDLGRGRLPLRLLHRRARVPSTILRDYLVLARLMLARPDQTVDEVVERDHPLYEPLIVPLTIAVLNATPDEAAAALLGRALRESFLRGGRACRPLTARRSLDHAFVEPALAWLRGRGVQVRFNARLRGLSFGRASLSGLTLADGEVPIAPQDAVILALPPAAAGELVPGLAVPAASSAILNAHFRVDGLGLDLAGPLGVLGGLAQWIFVRGDVVSTTTSAADAGMDSDAGMLAARLWQDVCAALGLRRPLPPWRVVKERRATFAQTPAGVASRPPPWTGWPNLFLAGDWIAGPLPATIEGAIRSGAQAADLACGVEGADEVAERRGPPRRANASEFPLRTRSESP